MKTLSTPAGIVGGMSRKIVLFACVVLLVPMFGCFGEQREKAKALVRSGVETSAKLETYYKTLKEAGSGQRDEFAFQTFRNARRPISQPIEDEFTRESQAIASRAKLAGQMKKMYEALGELIEYDASGEVTGAAVDLKNAIEDVAGKKLSFPGMPFAGVDPEVVLKKALGAIVDWIQIRQFRKNIPKVQIVLDGIINLYLSEMPVYRSIFDTYYNLALENNLYLHYNNQVSLSSIKLRSTELYGLTLQPDLPPHVPAPVLVPWADDRRFSREENDIMRKKVNEKYEQDVKNYRQYMNERDVLYSARMRELLINMLRTKNADLKTNARSETTALAIELSNLKRRLQDFLTQ